MAESVAICRDNLRAKTILGNRIVYYDRGTGPALVLLHGMFGDHLDWEPVLEPLSQTHRVIAIDLPGFGESDKPDLDYKAEFFVHTIHLLLDELKIRRAVLAGNAFGGEIATLVAHARPEMVGALLLVDGGGIVMFTPEELEAFERNFVPANLQRLTPEFHEIFFSRVLRSRGESWQRYIARQNAKLSRADYAAYTVALQRCARLAAELDVRPILAGLEVPTLLLWGEHDSVFPVAKAREALPEMKHTRWGLIADAGHSPQLENPEEFVEKVETFLASLPETRLQ